MDLDAFHVAAPREPLIHVQHKCATAGHAGRKVGPDFAQHDNQSAGHVFAAMMPQAFHHGRGAGIPHRKTLAGLAGRKQLTTGSAIETGVTHDDAAFSHDAGVGIWRNGNSAPAHPFTHIIVGVANQVQVHTLGVPDPETLPRRTHERQLERLTRQPGPAVVFCNLARHGGANRSIMVTNIEAKRSALTRPDAVRAGNRDGLIELALVMRVIANTPITGL